MVDNDIINKLDEVINAIPDSFKDIHSCSPHWYVSELCRYLQGEIRKWKIEEQKYNIILYMPIEDIRQMLHYKGLSFFNS